MTRSFCETLLLRLWQLQDGYAVNGGGEGDGWVPMMALDIATFLPSFYIILSLLHSAGRLYLPFAFPFLPSILSLSSIHQCLIFFVSLTSFLFSSVRLRTFYFLFIRQRCLLYNNYISITKQAYFTAPSKHLCKAALVSLISMEMPFIR